MQKILALNISAFAMCGSLLLPLQASAESATDRNKIVVRDGQWSTIVAILDNSSNHYLLKTSVSDDPEQCLTNLSDTASKVKQAGGLIWTDPQKNVISYERKAGYAERGVKVLELRCVLEPFSGELVQKY